MERAIPVASGLFSCGAAMGIEREPTDDPAYPPFGSDLLNGVWLAYARRSKAISVRTRGCDCARADEESAERLNLDVQTMRERPTQIRLSIWPDGAMWLGIHRPGVRSEGGWDFQFRSHGDVREVEAVDVIVMLEDTIDVVCEPDASTVEQIERIWGPAGLGVY